MELKSLESILIVGRQKDHIGPFTLLQRGEHLEPIFIGHLYVEKDQVRSAFTNRGNRFVSTTYLANNLYLGIGRKKAPDLAAGGWFIIDKQDSDLAHECDTEYLGK